MMLLLLLFVCLGFYLFCLRWEGVVVVVVVVVVGGGGGGGGVKFGPKCGVQQLPCFHHMVHHIC